MEILNGLYQLIEPRTITEKHGGAILKDQVYWFLAFYGENLVGMYGSDENDYSNYRSKQFELNGKVMELRDNNIKFHIYNPNIDDTLIFEGRLMEHKEILNLTGKYDKKKSPWGGGLYKLISGSSAIHGNKSSQS